MALRSSRVCQKLWINRRLSLLSSRPCLVQSCLVYSKNSKGDEGDHLRPPTSLVTFIVKKYVGYISKFEVKVQNNYPKFYKVYRLFKDGIVEFFKDTKLYSVLTTRIWAGEALSIFTWKELEVFRQMPSDLLKSAPVLIAAPLPFVPYFFYPICYMFPRQLLCRYFWTDTQKLEFGLLDLRHRLPFYPRIFQFLQRHSIDIWDPAQRKLFEDILHKLENGSHPSVDELVEVKGLFRKRPFGFYTSHNLHMWHLARSLDFSTISHKRFMNSSILLHHIDLALIREGVKTLSTESLQQSCFTRGLNPCDLSEEEMIDFLEQWLQLSQNVDESTLSLLVHAPVLLAFNRPSNRRYLVQNVDVR